MAGNRLVLFVEGEGDVPAVVRLVRRILSEKSAFPDIQLDEPPMRVGGLKLLICSRFNWTPGLRFWTSDKALFASGAPPLETSQATVTVALRPWPRAQ